MNALTRNLVMCAWPGDCVQPGTVDVYCDSVELEFCERHADKAKDLWTPRVIVKVYV